MLAEIADSADASRHKCLIYDGDPSEQLPVVIPFLADGLRNNWRCLYLGSPEMVRMVDSALAAEGIDAASELKKGALVLSSERSHLSNGSFEPGMIIDMLCALIDSAVQDGFNGLCATGDMKWELGKNKNFDRLLEYEARLDQIFREKPLRGICQYHRDLVPKQAVHQALVTHQTAYIDGMLNRDNFFYVPPELLLEAHHGSAGSKRGEWMCQQIIRILKAEEKRDRALKALRESEAHQRHLAGQLAEMNSNLEKRVKERTAELEVANRHLEAFSYSVSHDLRGPLQSIAGFSEILAKECAEALDEKGREHLHHVRTSAQRMAELIDGLLTLSGVVGANLKRVPVDLSSLAVEVVREIRHTAAGRSGEFVIYPGMHVVGDRILIRSVLANLVGNAWKFTSKISSTRIEIGQMRDESGQAVFFVRDNGAGFEMECATKLFNAFQRLHKQSEFPGNGIGLATVQRIISKHGGRIWAESRPNQGATFFFTLPGDIG
jgi:signal transduction histidine kinase